MSWQDDRPHFLHVDMTDHSDIIQYQPDIAVHCVIWTRNLHQHKKEKCKGTHSITHAHIERYTSSSDALSAENNRCPCRRTAVLPHAARGLSSRSKVHLTAEAFWNTRHQRQECQPHKDLQRQLEVSVMKEAYFLKTQSSLALQGGRISRILSVGILVDPSWKCSHSSHLQPASYKETDVVPVFNLQNQ